MKYFTAKILFSLLSAFFLNPGLSVGQAASVISELDQVALIMNGVMPGEIRADDYVLGTWQVGDGIFRMRSKAQSSEVGYREYRVKKIAPCRYVLLSSLVDGEGVTYSTQNGYVFLDQIAEISYVDADAPDLYSLQSRDFSLANYLAISKHIGRSVERI